MFQIRVDGLNHINELSEIFSSLKHIEFQLRRSASGEIDMERSMLEMERAVDHKLQPFSHNPLAAQVGGVAKQQFREQIQKHAAESRRHLHSSGFPIFGLKF